MKLNLYILVDDLEKYSIRAKLTSNPCARDLRFAMRFVPARHTQKLHADRLYVCYAEDLADCTLEVDGRLSLICIGGIPPAELTEAGFDIAWIEERVSIDEILEHVSELFACYDEWLADLHAAIDRNAPLRQLGVMSEHIFKNPIWMWDSQYQTVFHVISEGNYALPSQYKMHNDAESWPVEELNAVDDEFKSAQKERTPYFLKPLFGYTSLCYNLYVGGSFNATVSVDGVGKPLTSREIALIKVLGDAMAKNHLFRAQVSKHIPFALGSATEKLIRGEAVPEDKLARSLHEKGWNRFGRYRCFEIRPLDDVEYPSPFLITTAEHICDKMPETLFCLDEGSIVLVANLEAYTEKQLAMHHLRVFDCVKNKKLRASVGVSTEFLDYANLRYFYKQAGEALDLNRKSAARESVYRFEDCMVSAIVARCNKDSIPETLAPPSLIRLKAYDKENDSDLVSVLRSYLSNNLSANKTAQDLFMHRNTLLGRLKKIEAVGRLSLDDPTAQLILRIALMINDDALDS